MEISEIKEAWFRIYPSVLLLIKSLFPLIQQAGLGGSFLRQKWKGKKVGNKDVALQFLLVILADKLILSYPITPDPQWSLSVEFMYVSSTMTCDCFWGLF